MLNLSKISESLNKTYPYSVTATILIGTYNQENVEIKKVSSQEEIVQEMYNYYLKNINYFKDTFQSILDNYEFYLKTQEKGFMFCHGSMSSKETDTMKYSNEIENVTILIEKPEEHGFKGEVEEKMKALISKYKDQNMRAGYRNLKDMSNEWICDLESCLEGLKTYIEGEEYFDFSEVFKRNGIKIIDQLYKVEFILDNKKNNTFVLGYPNYDDNQEWNDFIWFEKTDCELGQKINSVEDDLMDDYIHNRTEEINEVKKSIEELYVYPSTRTITIKSSEKETKKVSSLDEMLIWIYEIFNKVKAYGPFNLTYEDFIIKELIPFLNSKEEKSIKEYNNKYPESLPGSPKQTEISITRETDENEIISILFEKINFQTDPEDDELLF